MAETPVTARGNRTERIRELMEARGLGALLLRRPANFAWYTGGADNRVDHSSPYGVADVVVTADREYVVTNTIEAGRLRDEVLPDIEVIEYPWFEDPNPTLREVIGGAPLGADVPETDGIDVSDVVTPLRFVLDDEALQRYRQVGADAVAAMAETTESLSPGMNEYEVSAILVAACRRRNLFAPVVLVAGDDRIARYRHPVVHGERFERRVMVVVCAERGGLYANLTRFVHFVEPDRDLRARFGACDEILRRLREEGTRPGSTMGEAFEDCRRYYEEAGFPGEWRLHHQGGMTGYASREVLAIPGASQAIQAGQAFAWNPSITGAKAEETFLLTASGPEVITADP